MIDPIWGALPGRLAVVSGPSGAGKSTLVRRVVARPGLDARLSVSATTRAPRPDEVPGRDYFFMSEEEFLGQREAGGLLESALVHGHWYGTPAPWVAGQLAEGRTVLLEIDVQGGAQVKKRVPSTLLVFVHVGGLDVLEARLRGRGTDSEATIQRRLENARGEVARAGEYDLVLVNDDLERATEALAQALLSFPRS